MTITLKRAAHCKQCGAALPIGSRAKWYRNGDVYGLNCHSRKSDAGPDGYQGEDYVCSDRGYEERMEREYERMNGRW
jgi:hypothetical protein